MDGTQAGTGDVAGGAADRGAEHESENTGRIHHVLMVVVWLCTVVLVWMSGSQAEAGSPGAKEILNLEGKVVHPLADPSAHINVFIFIKPDCPISNRYAPEVHRLEEKFAGQGVTFWMVYADADLSVAEIHQHIREYQYAGSIVRDPGHQLVDFCRARVTPEAAVVGRDGRLAYHGRIDDRYVALGEYRPTPTHRDLEQAITAVLHGGVVPPGHPAVGCTISPVE